MQQPSPQNTNGSSEPNHGPGRPTKCNEKTLSRLCKALADGMPIKSACAVAGIGVQTLSDWGKDNPELEARIEAAKEELRQKALQTSGRAITKDDWRAAEAALKLAFPEYRQNAKVEANAHANASAAAGNFMLPLSPERIADLQERRRKALEELAASKRERESVCERERGQSCE